MGLLLEAWALEGVGEIEPGDDLVGLIGNVLAASERGVHAGDILVISSKVLSKAEGRLVLADDRDDAITAETIRVVAVKATDDGVTRIVENRLGIVGAAAGVDASNTAEGTVLLLPEDPDGSARQLCLAWRERFEVALGVIISDTLGRPWRAGQTDVAIGAAGVRVLDDLRGQFDTFGKPLAVTQPAVADELASLGDLVKGKATGLPVAVVRGAGRFVTDVTPNQAAHSLLRAGPTDMFRLGTEEAMADGYRRGLVAGLGIAAGAMARWTIIVPLDACVCGTGQVTSPASFVTDAAQSQLHSLQALLDIGEVERVLVISRGDKSGPEPIGLEFMQDPGRGLNSAVADAVALAQRRDSSAFVAVLAGELGNLALVDLSAALNMAVAAARKGNPLGFVDNLANSGVMLATSAPRATMPTRLGSDSRTWLDQTGYVDLWAVDGQALV